MDKAVAKYGDGVRKVERVGQVVWQPAKLASNTLTPAMPALFQFEGYAIASSFFSNEGDPREPLREHIRKDGSRARYWLNPVGLAKALGWLMGKGDQTHGHSLAA